MRVIIRGLILTIMLSTGLASATELCGSPKLTQALQYVQWHETNLGYNQQARMTALEDSMEIHSLANTTAWVCSVLFLISVSMLAGSITYRLLENKNLALSLGGVYLTFFAFVLIASREPVSAVVNEFRNEINTVKTAEIPTDIPGPESLREILQMISREQARVPEVFSEMATYLPPEGRWWTMGWDEVSLVNFQAEAYRALIRKGNFGLRTISTIRLDLQKKCRESGIEI